MRFILGLLLLLMLLQMDQRLKQIEERQCKSTAGCGPTQVAPSVAERVGSQLREHSASPAGAPARDR